MEARFNEKVREYHDAINGAGTDADKEALETEMYDYMARTAPFIREYHQEAKTESVTKTVGNIKITSQKGICFYKIYNFVAIVALVTEDQEGHPTISSVNFFNSKY